MEFLPKDGLEIGEKGLAWAVIEDGELDGEGRVCWSAAKVAIE